MAPHPIQIQAGDVIQRFELFERASSSLFKKYEAAITQMRARLEVLNADLEYRVNRNPIHNIESRLKKPSSVYEKLQRRGLPPTIDSMEEHITDIAGVRVICSYIDDVYMLEKVLLSQDDLHFIKRKDYIAQPKPNGYRSLHLIVSIPIYFLDRKQNVPVEIQLRTIAMDFWASLEHTLRYKHKSNNLDDKEMHEELRWCSHTIDQVERRMQRLMRTVETNDFEEAARKRRKQIYDQIQATNRFNIPPINEVTEVEEDIPIEDVIKSVMGRHGSIHKRS